MLAYLYIFVNKSFHRIYFLKTHNSSKAGYTFYKEKYATLNIMSKYDILYFTPLDFQNLLCYTIRQKRLFKPTC